MANEYIANGNAVQNFGYLAKQAEADASVEVEKATLADIEQYASMYDHYTEKVNDLEEQLTEAKRELNKVSQKLIPEAFISLGMSSVRLKDGREFGYKEEVSCSVKDFKKFEEFLEKQGDASIIKTVFELGKVPKPILQKLSAMIFEKFGLLVTPNQTVHSQTLAKYIRTLCGIGGVSKAVMSVEELDKDMINVYTFYKTTVKNKTKKGS